MSTRGRSVGAGFSLLYAMPSSRPGLTRQVRSTPLLWRNRPRIRTPHQASYRGAAYGWPSSSQMRPCSAESLGVVAQIFRQILDPAAPTNISSFGRELKTSAAMKGALYRAYQSTLRFVLSSIILFSTGDFPMVSRWWHSKLRGKTPRPVPVAFRELFLSIGLRCQQNRGPSLDPSVPFRGSRRSRRPVEGARESEVYFRRRHHAFRSDHGATPGEFTLERPQNQTGRLRITEGPSSGAEPKRKRESAARQISIVAGRQTIFKILMVAMVPRDRSLVPSTAIRRAQSDPLYFG